MKDFGHWFQDLKPAQAPPPQAEAASAQQQTHLYPDSVFYGFGVYYAYCRACGQSYELPCDPEEFTEAGNYCGGSPRCTP